MKQKLLLTLIAIMAQIVGVRAANTLTVADVAVVQGGQADVVVNYNFTSTYYGFQIETALLSGITVGDCTIGSSPGSQGFSVNHALLSSGTHRFIGYEASHKALSTGSGELFHFTITAASNMATGTYPVTLNYVEFTNSQGKRELLSQVTFNVTVYNYTELKNQMTQTLASITDELDRLQALYNSTNALYEQLKGCLPDDDYDQVAGALNEYDNPLYTLQNRKASLAAQLSSAQPSQYYDLNTLVNALNSDVSTFSTTMTVGIANLNETVKAMAAADLRNRLSTMGQNVANLGAGSSNMEAVRLEIVAQTGNYYFERTATDEFNSTLADATSKLQAYKTSVDSLTNVYNTLVSQNSISSVETAISFYNKFFALADGYDNVSARSTGAQAAIDALQTAYNGLEVNFPEQYMFFEIRPTDLTESRQMGFKEDLGYVLTSGGIMQFEQVDGCEFRLVDLYENYVVAQAGNATLKTGTEAEATIWTGISLHNGNYLLHNAATGRYLAYNGIEVNSAVNASATAHAWTIVESNLDPLQALINMLAEEGTNPSESSDEPVDFHGLDEEDICEDCNSRDEQIIIPPVPYPIRITQGYLPVPRPERPREEDYHPIYVQQGAHLILDDITIKDYVGGHHVIYVEGILEINVNVIVNIREWEWFIQVGPTGRVIWRKDDDKPRIKNEGTLDMEEGQMQLVDNTGTVNHKGGTITEIINRNIYNFTGGIINKAHNHGTMNHSAGNILTARNYADGTWNMTGGSINNTVVNTTDTVYVNYGKFYFTGGIISGYCSRLIYHGPNAFMRIDGGRFGFTGVRHYFIEAHNYFYIRGDYDYAATVPILLKPSVTIRLLYNWIYNFNVTFIGGMPTSRYPLFWGDGFTLSTNHYRYIGWTLPNHRWRWYYSADNNTIEPRDEEVWDEDDLLAYFDWLDTYRDSEAASTEDNPQVLDLGGRQIVLTKPVVMPVGTHVVIKNGSFIPYTTWTYNYMFQVPDGSSLRLDNVVVDFSSRTHYVYGGSVVQRYIFDVIGKLYVGPGTHIIGYLDSSRPATDTYIPGASIRVASTGYIYLDSGWMENVVICLNKTVNVFVAGNLAHEVFVYLPTTCRYNGFRIMGPYRHTITRSDINYVRFYNPEKWNILSDTDGYMVLANRLLGDANGDGDVSLIDVIVTVDYLLGQNPEVFYFYNADVNEDNTISLIDILGIVDIILSQVTYDAPANSRMSMTDKANISVNNGHCTLNLENSESFVALRATVKLPKGAEMRNVVMESERADGHQVLTQAVAPGRYNLVVYSKDGNVMRDGSAPLLHFDVSGCKATEIIVDGIQLVNKQYETVLLPAISGATNGIVDVEADDSNQQPYYNITGARVNKPTRGIYIQNGRKVVVK